MPRSRTVARVLDPQQRGVRILTAVILLAGAGVLFWLFSPGERERRGIMERVELGDRAERLVELIGTPRDCPPTQLDHLRASFPDATPPAQIEESLDRMARETRRRWVYPLDLRKPARCSGAEGQTEVGVDAEERIVWYVAVTGKSTLRIAAPLEAGG